MVEQFAQIDGVGSVGAAGPCRSIRSRLPAVEGVTVAVVLHPFFGVAQHRIGRLDLFELVGRVLIPGPDVGVIFAHELLVRLANLLGGGVAADSQRLIKIDFGHKKGTALARCIIVGVGDSRFQDCLRHCVLRLFDRRAK